MATTTTRTKFLQGNEACLEGALAAGVRFFAGYPITPSSEIAEGLARRLPMVGGKFIQMEDEIAAMGAVIGASLTGVKSLTATSGPGFSLKQENIGYACMAEIPVTIINVMRGGPSTGLPTLPSQADVMQARWGTHGDHPAIALSPGNVQEVFWETVRAVNLSEKFRTPVIVLLDEIIGHMRTKIVIPDPSEIEIINRKKPTVPPERYNPYEPDENLVPPMANFGEGYRYHVTGLNHDKTGFPTADTDIIQFENERLVKKIERGKHEIFSHEDYLLEDAQIAIVTYGSTSGSARLAVQKARSQGYKAGMYRLKTVWPFPDEEINLLAKRVSNIIVPELNLGQIVLEVQRSACGESKITPLNQVNGQSMMPERILQVIKEVA